MNAGGVVPWDDFKPVLRQFNCPCCTGVRFMPDGEELEQRVTDILDKSREDVREAILALELNNMQISLEKTKAVMENDNNVPRI